MCICQLSLFFCVWIYNISIHTDAVARFESFRALKLSRYERALNLSNLATASVCVCLSLCHVLACLSSPDLSCLMIFPVFSFGYLNLAMNVLGCYICLVISGMSQFVIGNYIQKQGKPSKVLNISCF